MLHLSFCQKSRKIFLFFIAVAFLVTLLLPYWVVAADNAAAIDKVFSKRKAVGASFAVAYNNSIIYDQYYGYEHKATKTAVTNETYIRVSSVTKMIVAIGAMQLVEQNLIDLDEDISTYLGYRVYNPHYPDIPLTVRQILTHTSTLNGSVSGTGEKALKEIIGNGSKSKKNFKNKKPGTTYQYSNFGYGVLGAIIENVSGENINAYLQTHVFLPLDIDAALHPSYLKNQTHLATTYDDGKVFKTGEAYLKGYSLFDSSVNPEHHYLLTFGNLWIKATDMTKLLIALCGDGSYNGTSILSYETVLLMRQDQKGVGSVTGETRYGLGLERVTSLIEGRTLYGHQGMSRGMMANAYFDPETSLCFTVISNGCSQARENRVSYLARGVAPFAYGIAGLPFE